MWKHIASNAMTLFILALIALASVIAWGQRQYAGPGPLEAAICVEVPSGTNMRRVSQDLLAQGAISNDSIFRVGSDYAGKADDLKAGSFLVPSGASMAEIVDILTRGGANTCGTEIVFRVGVNSARVEVRELDPETNRFVEQAEFVPGVDAVPAVYEAARASGDTRFRIALAEGVTSWQVLEELRMADFLVQDTDVVPSEGSLAPDSYEVSVGASLAELLSEMQSRQTARLDAAWRDRADGLPIASIGEALTLASIVEKETGVAEERRQVASVFINRLERGIRLQTDPTVIYGITNGQGVLGRGLRQSELARETPYNTYVISGLPPTPIANPGLASIEAALNPADTSYLFFVADGTGGHAFAETLAEHNRNVAAWRAIEAQQSGE
jgi:UPF0755 protein